MRWEDAVRAKGTSRRSFTSLSIWMLIAREGNKDAPWSGGSEGESKFRQRYLAGLTVRVES
jgi:hypothetical protein